ncbi:hypothetical protein D3C72_2292030 [compost metagenome]
MHILPALPPVWSDGEIKGLRARQGLTVDLKWSQGNLISVTLTADEDTTVKLRYKDHVKKVKVGGKKPLILNRL